jgi:hypothetical protein
MGHRNGPGAWQVSLQILARPGLSDVEYTFAAQTLRNACSKSTVRSPGNLDLATVRSLLRSDANARSVAGIG